MADEALDRAELQTRAIRGGLWTILHVFVSLPIAFVVNLVLARVLGVVDYGRLAFLTTFMEIAGAVLAVGVGQALMQFGAKAHSAGRRDAVRDLLAKTQGFRLAFVAPVLTLAVVLVADVPLWLLVVAVLFGVILPAAISGAPACLAIQSRTDRGAQLGLVGTTVMQVAVVVTVFTIASPDAVWSVRLIVGGLTGAAALILIDRGYRRAVLRPRLPRHMPSGFWAFALPTGLAGLVGTLALTRAEIMLLQAMSTPTAVGLYALAFGVSAHLFAPAQALVNPLIPAIAGIKEVDADAMGRALGRTLRGSSSVIALIVATVLPGLVLLVPRLYGSEFDQVPAMLLVLGIFGSYIVLAGPLNVFIMARLSGRALLRISLLALAVDAVLAVALIPQLGAWGAVIAKVGAVVTQFTLLLLTELAHVRAHRREVLLAMLPSVLGSAAACAGWWAGSSISSDIGGAVLASSVGLAIYLLALAGCRSGLQPSDVDAVVRALPSAIRGPSGLVLRLVTWGR